MSVLPPEPDRKAIRTPPPSRVEAGARPKDFGTLRARFQAPPLPQRRAADDSPAKKVARLLERTRKNRPPDKEMIDIEALVGDVDKDTPSTWDDFHRELAGKQQALLDAAKSEPALTTGEEALGIDLPIAPQLAQALADMTFAFADAPGVRRKIAGPHPLALAHTEVRAGPRGSDQAGLLRWAHPGDPTSNITSVLQPGGVAPDTGGMATEFGGSTGRGIFVLTEGRLHVTDTTNYASLFGEHNVQAYHSSITGGRPVEAAGEIEIKNGRVVAVSNLSGHYRPGPEHMLTTLAWLSGRGIDVSKIKVGILNREYTGADFVKAGGDVTALEAAALRKRGAVIGTDPVTGRKTASITHPTRGVISDLSVGAQQRILDAPPGPLDPNLVNRVLLSESELHDRQAAAARQANQAGPAQPTTSPQAASGPNAAFTERRATVSNLLRGRRGGTVANRLGRFEKRT